jgi:predicted acylesterase/phospholipase RssA
MAWNGGVSLAVWMGGAAVELDAARRAHIDPPAGQDPERPVYSALCDAFDRMLVIDILAGASAGGINGALLGAVITTGRRLDADFLRKRWLELGNLSALLQPANDLQPPSLLRGDYFREAIHEAFREVLGDDEKPLPRQPNHPGLEPADVVLDIQTTNVAGGMRGFPDKWGQTLYAAEYRAPIRFREPDDYTSEALAAAARASASFPAAFAPLPLTGDGARLGGFPGVKRWAIDGGLLENAPIRPALDLIPTRRSNRVVSRFVCYVNAAPKQKEDVPDDPEEPKLAAILGYTVNLPRDARFIDHLVAIEDAAHRSNAVGEVSSGLLDVDLGPLRATADALLPAYRKQRTLQSLREAVKNAGEAIDMAATVDTIVERLDSAAGRSLPWIPSGLEPPSEAAGWRWGLRAAQRILLLQLDIVRNAIEGSATQEEADALLALLLPVDKALVRLENARDRFAESRPIGEAVLALAELPESKFDEGLEDLDALMVGFRGEVLDALERGTENLYLVLKGAASRPGLPSAEQLFGESTAPELGPAHFAAFLERALCIEVVRRSFASDRDMEPAQKLNFVQLTPLAPVRLFTPTPLSRTGPASGWRKLTGLSWAHFSAFYRSSWRANDFMWGRLDAASRIVDLLVDAKRAQRVSAYRSETSWQTLAELLTPEGADLESTEKRLLVTEALRDAARTPPPPRVSEQVAEAARGLGDGKPTREQLVERLLAALEADLADPKGGFFTQVVCARAAQYEILRQELGPLAEATAADGKLGCFTQAITLTETRGPLANARELVGAGTPESPTLPQLLGSGSSDEKTSTLAVRTLSHAVLVLLASLKTLGVPLAGTFAPIRAPFLAIAGVTAEKWWNRVAALVVFVAGSIYLTARALTAEGEPPAKLSSLWNPGSLAAIVAVLAVVGLVVLPLWRATQARLRGRKIRQALWALALFATSGLAALVCGFFDVGTANTIASTRGFALPTALSWLVVGASLGAPVIVRRLPIPAVGKRGLSRFAMRPEAASVLTTLVAVVVLAYAAPELWGAIDDGGWRAAAAVAAFASVPVAFLYGLHGFVRAGWDRLRFRKAMR